MVVGDQGPLDGSAGQPIVPDGGVEHEQPLEPRAHGPAGTRPPWRSKAELVLQGPDDRLDALPQPVREVPGGFLVFADRADQGQAQVRADEERLGVLAGTGPSP